MQLENSGKQIKKISFAKKHVTIYFDDASKMKISKEAYTNAYLFVGKKLNKEDIKLLERMTSLDKGLEYAFSLIKKKHYTEWKLREKLYEKEIDKRNIDAIIIFLKDNDLINDDMFILDFIEEAKEKGYGKHKIIAKLKEKGIFEEKTNKIKFPNSVELSKAKSLLSILERKYSKLSFESKKKHIYDALIRQGFESSIVLEVLKFIKKPSSKDEQTKLEIEYKKILVKLERKPIEDSFQRREFILNKLLSKGFRYNEIIKILED